ncbi:MAG: hypothetical protein JW891_00975 [Candidatus Lokiarchaeota archaeon]|nr:hypothetical protein [Candidatus Lokiarchaeota archaeon]
MELLKKFNDLMKEDILHFYANTDNYIKDLFSYKNIDLKGKTDGKPPQRIKETIETMIKITMVSLKTIGIPNERVERKKAIFNQISRLPIEQDVLLEQYFKKIKQLVNYFLYLSVIDYLTGKDNKQLDTADLFDLLPKGLKNKVNKFKLYNSISSELEHQIYEKLNEIEEDFDFSNLSIKQKKIKLQKPVDTLLKDKLLSKNVIEHQEPEIKVTKKPLFGGVEKGIPSSPHEKEEKIQNKISEILKQELKSTEKFGSLQPIPQPKEESIINNISSAPAKQFVVFTDQPNKQNNQKSSVISSPLEKMEAEQKKTLDVQTSFIEYFGDFPNLKKDILEQFNVNITNLSNSYELNLRVLDLETLFYFISTARMMGSTIPFSSIELEDITKKFIHNKVFYRVDSQIPDTTNIFYGLCIFREFNMLNRDDLVDLNKIKLILEEELHSFIPEKIRASFHAALGLKILEKQGIFVNKSNNLIDSVIQANLSKMEYYNPSNDIFEQLVLIKLYETEDKSIPTHFKGVYSKELKSVTDNMGSINGRVSDTAKALLSFVLLDLKDKESDACKKWLSYISGATKYFDTKDMDGDFNWKEHELAYLVELKMLFWMLLASSQYSELI